MKKVLEELLNKSGEIQPAIPTQGLSKPVENTDVQILKNVEKISSIYEKEIYLKGILNDDLSIYSKPKSAHYLFKLIKDKEPAFAFHILILLSSQGINSPEPYFEIAEMAINDKAWLIAKSALEMALCFSIDDYEIYMREALSKLNKVKQKLRANKTDNSSSEFWKKKEVVISDIIYLLAKSLKITKLVKYFIRLLDLFTIKQEDFLLMIYVLEAENSAKSFSVFLKHIKESSVIAEINKQLYVGILDFCLGEIDASNLNLKLYLESSKDSSICKEYIAYCYLVTGQLDNFKAVFSELVDDFQLTNKDLNQIDSKILFKLIGVYFIFKAILGHKYEPILLKYEKQISYQLSLVMSSMFKHSPETFEQVISKFKELDYFILLPNLILFLCERFVQNNKLAEARNILSYTEDVEKHRLISWIYRLEGNEKGAEEELLYYRKVRPLNKVTDIRYNLVELDLPQIVKGDSEEQFLSHLSNIYIQLEELKQKLSLEYGLLRSTCFETDCTDCCRKTYPVISYTEYLYLKKWLDKQPANIKQKIYERSVEIVNDFRAKYNKEPLFLSPKKTEKDKHYPSEFTFDCPALVENKCTVFEAQPIMCRSYGYSGVEKKKFKGCNYYKEQFCNASGLSNERKVIDVFSLNDFVSDIDDCLIGTKVIAPIPVWFAQDYEETLFRAKTHILSNGIFSPLINLISRRIRKKSALKSKSSK